MSKESFKIDKSLVLIARNIAPSLPELGEMYYDSTNGIQVYDGSLFQSVATQEYVDGAVSSVDVSGKADTNLNNLVSPTLVNVHLEPSSSFLRNLGSTSRVWNTGHIQSLAGSSLPVSIHVGNRQLIDTSNNTSLTWGANVVSFKHLVPDANNVRDIGSPTLGFANGWWAGPILSGGNGGTHALMSSGLITPSGATAVNFTHRNLGLQTHISLYTFNNSTNNTTSTGDVLVETGNKTVGTANSGNIQLRTGEATGTRGTINLIDGSLSGASVGYVWTLQNTSTGAGSWAAAGSGGANTTLSNLTSPTAINQNLLPSGDNSQTLGSASLAWSQLHTYSFTAQTQMQLSPGGSNRLNISFNGVLPSGPTASAFMLSQANHSLGIYVANGASTSNLNIETGNASSGNSGNITLQTGTATGTRGSVLINAQSMTITLPTSQKFTLAGTQVDFLPSSSNQDLGSSSFPWAQIYAKSGLSSGAIQVLDTASTSTLLSIHTNRTTPSGITTGANVYNPSQELGDGKGGLQIFTSTSTASSAAVRSGNLNIETGARTTGTLGASSGYLSLITGNSNNGPSGNIILQTGTGTVRGDVLLDSNKFNVTSVNEGKGLPIWKKYTVSHTAFQTASLTNSITLFGLPAHGVIHNVVISHSTAFAGTGITGYTVEVGISGNTNKYASAFDVFQATGDGVGQTSSVADFESKGGSTNILVTANSSGANLDQSTDGSVDIWVLWGTMQ